MKPKRKHYRRKVRTNQGKLMDGKINTIVERRIVEISRKQIDKNNPSLCLRRYCWVDYDPFTNKFTHLEDSTGQPIVNKFDWEGDAVNLTDKIIKQDIATMANVGVVDDLKTQLNEAVQSSNMGTNVLTAITPEHGYRRTDSIIVTGFDIKYRVRAHWSPPDDPAYKDYDRITVYISLIKIRRAINDNGSEHIFTPSQLLKLRPWGYHSVLDSDVEKDDAFRPVVLAKDSFSMTTKSNETANIIFRKMRGKFKNPVKIQYDARDIKADRNNYDIFLVVRSTVASTGDDEDIQYQPIIQACAKLYYKNII